MNVAVIPARGGSKRIPRKNIRLFAGRPMISHAISTAIDSGLFDHVVVSTDDVEIAGVARDCGAEVPFFRPSELADDHVPTVPVVVHAIHSCRRLGWQFERVCCIYPTVPLLHVADLRGALDLLSDSSEAYCFPVARFQSAVQRALRRLEDGKLAPLYPQHALTRTQDLEPSFYDAGQFYWGKADSWLAHPSIHASAVGYRIPGWRAIDIDDPEDWERAEALVRYAAAMQGRGAGDSGEMEGRSAT